MLWSNFSPWVTRSKEWKACRLVGGVPKSSRAYCLLQILHFYFSFLNDHSVTTIYIRVSNTQTRRVIIKKLKIEYLKWKNKRHLSVIWGQDQLGIRWSKNEWSNDCVVTTVIDKNLRISVATVTRDSLLDHILTWSFSFGTRWLSISLRIFSLWSFTYNFVQNVQVLVRTRSLIELQNQNIFCIQVKLIIKSMVICCCLSPPHRW